jgi:hypothetical protein
MHPIPKVFFFSLLIYLITFLPLLAGSADLAFSLEQPTKESRNRTLERRFESNPRESRMESQVHNSNDVALSPQEQEAIKTITDDFLVNDDTEASRQRIPDIAREPSGNFVITWEDRRNGEASPDIYAQRYNSSGNPIGSNFKVNDAGTYQLQPAIAMDCLGNFVITWMDERNGNYDIYAQRYNFSGAPLGSNFKVSDDAGAADQLFPAIAMDGSGDFVITWDDERSGTDNDDIYVQRYNSSGTPQGSNFKVNDDAGIANQWTPDIAMDDSGNFIITWYDTRNGNYDIYAQRYYSSGNPIGSNFRVNNDVGTANQYIPHVAIDSSGNFVITWLDYRNYPADIYAQRYDSSGTPQGSNFKVNEDVEITYRHSPDIAIDGPGNFVITWDDDRNGDFEVYAQRFDSSGGAQGSNFKVSDDTGTTDQYWAFIAMDGSGNFIITWQDERNGTDDVDIYAQRYDSSGTPDGSNFKVNDAAAGSAEQDLPAIAMHGSGNFVITWEDERNGTFWPDIYAQRFNSSGDPQDSNFKVDDGDEYAGQYSPAVAMGGFGNFVITWQDTRNGAADIYAQRFDSSGSPQDSNFRVDDDLLSEWQYYPAIAMDGSGNFVITWCDGRDGTYDIYAQRYDSSGIPLGANFRVNDDPTTRHQFFPAIAMNSSGDFVITWEDLRTEIVYNDIYAQRYDSSGSPIDSNFKVNDDAWGIKQYSPAIAIDGSGNFVITWDDERNGNNDIYAQRYDSSGNPQGSNFKVNDDAGTASQSSPAIAMDDSGRFVITWTDDRNGNDDIYAQRYDASGTPADSNYLVSDSLYSSFEQKTPAVAINDSIVCFSWTDNRSDVSGDIYGKLADWNWLTYICGDVNEDGVVNIADVVYLINYLFAGGSPPVPWEAGDVNLDGVVNIADVVYLINYLFAGGSPPCS